MYHPNFSCYVTVRESPSRSRFFSTAEVSAMTDTTASFEADTVGAPPKGWTATKTGKGDPKWTIEQDKTAPSNSKVVKQSGWATYPLLLKDDTDIKDGFMQIKFKAVAGSEDRAGGVVWRARDANNYYVVRANALEDNVVLYRTVDGVRSALDIVGRKGGYGVAISVPANEWLTLRVEFKGSRFRVLYNGRQLFEVEDSTFPEGGKVGLWTKADSVTLFDALTYGAAK
jgi:hypothetical protein